MQPLRHNFFMVLIIFFQCVGTFSIRPSTQSEVFYKAVGSMLKKSVFSITAAAVGSFSRTAYASLPSLDNKYTSSTQLKESCRVDILSGRVYIHDNFIDPLLVESLRGDVYAAREAGLFRSAGLSNSA